MVRIGPLSLTLSPKRGEGGSAVVWAIPAREWRPFDLRRLFEPINFERSFGALSVAIESLSGELQFDRLVLRLPFIGRDGGLKGGVTDVDAALIRSCFARAVGHVGIDAKRKRRLFLLGYGEIG